MGRLFVLLLLAGCAATPGVPGAEGPYVGPTLAPPQVMAVLRDRAERVPTLWANGEFAANFVDGDRSDFVNGSLVILHEKPDRIRILGNKATTRVFDIGLNDTAYWALVKGGTDTLWYGSRANLDAVDPRALPVRPDQLADVLGLGAVDTDLLAEPFPVVRFNPDDDVYMVIWHARRTDLPGGPRVVAVREVWYDRETLDPKYVWLFDDDGRIVVRGDLSDSHPIVDAGDARLARRYDLYFPETGSTMELTLDELRLSYRRIPNARSFVPPDPQRPGVGHVVDLDANPDRQPGGAD